MVQTLDSTVDFPLGWGYAQQQQPKEHEMNVSPKTMAQQVRKAQAVKSERERIARMGGTRKAFTSESGVERVQYRGVESALQGLVVMEDDPHCFICSRHTDHFAEHDDMVEAGYAQYESDGSVTWTEKGWNEYKA